MVASPLGTSFFGTRLMTGFGGLSNEPLFFIISAQGDLDLEDYDFYVSVAHSLLGDH